MNTVVELERGREAYLRRAWLDADKLFCLADEAAPLPASDLESMGTAEATIG